MNTNMWVLDTIIKILITSTSLYLLAISSRYMVTSMYKLRETEQYRYVVYTVFGWL